MCCEFRTEYSCTHIRPDVEPCPKAKGEAPEDEGPCTEVYKPDLDYSPMLCSGCHVAWLQEQADIWESAWQFYLDAGKNDKDLKEKVKLLRKGYENTLSEDYTRWSQTKGSGLYKSYEDRVQELAAEAQSTLKMFHDQAVASSGQQLQYYQQSSQLQGSGSGSGNGSKSYGSGSGSHSKSSGSHSKSGGSKWKH